MKKTAIVYDKWLESLGGGEVVACNFARILADLGYDTTFICGKLVDLKKIKSTINIDLSDIKFVECWNDEVKLKSLTKNADVFLNTTFIDYSQGNAKQNILYVYFPTDTDDNPKDKIINRFILPLILRFIKPVEIISETSTQTRYAIYYLKPGQKYQIKFKIKINNFSKSNLDKIHCHLENCQLIDTKITINHFSNCLEFRYQVVPTNSTIYLNLDHVDLSEMNISSPWIVNVVSRLIRQKPVLDKLNIKFRAGLYPHLLKYLNHYQQIFSTSNYSQKWIKKYWNIPVTTFYPPVSLIASQLEITKKNQICSVGRFFTSGHNKKQDVLINAFKKLYDQGQTNWELHLAGGLGTEASSIKYITQLKTMAKGYPIYFHLNQSRQFIEKLYLESKIYWHAAGFGVDPNLEPIKFEHFGITPIEAMSAGCVPVVFKGGGLTEVIKQTKLNPKIHLFKTIDQLVNHTNIIINQQVKLPPNNYQLLSNLFGLARFKQQLITILNHQQNKT